MDTWEKYVAQNQPRFIDELVEFLKIPSISSLPEHKEEVQRAGRWVADRMVKAGIQNVQVMPTGGHPVVYGDWCHAGDLPTIMVYGHFDTQPVDPLSLWVHPPFDPVITDGRIYARGASDDKGNMLIPILAAEAWLKTAGTLPVNVKFLFEGQEEIGSPELDEFIAGNKALLSNDMVFSADGGQWRKDQPALLMGLRGLCALQVDVKGADGDLHSGTFGGAIANPIHALSRMLSSLHDTAGRITIEGFYDKVAIPSSAEREIIATVPYDETAYCRDIGVPAVFGEPGYNTYERSWLRPTVEVNGVWGGFQGEGTKTVLPGAAHAKISCRLVPDQDPEEIREKVALHLETHLPKGVTVSIQRIEASAAPYRIPHDHPGNRAAEIVHRALYGKAPYQIWMGGSIPFCGIMKKHLGSCTVNFAFGLNDEAVHAPNEFFRLKSFQMGQMAYGMLLAELAGLSGP